MALSATTPSLSEARGTSEFWRASLALGFTILGFEAIAALLYLRGTSTLPYRGQLFVIVAAVLVLSAAGLRGARFVSRQRWRSQFCFLMTTGTTVVLSLCMHLDGGLGSPLLYLAVLPVMYAGLLFRPRPAMLCGVIALAGLVAVGMADPEYQVPQENVLMFDALMLGGAVLATGTARHRCRLEAERAFLVSELRRRASTDDLTGCWNQATFHLRLTEEASRAHRHQRPLSLIICDVDLLRQFNQTYGHDGGDMALREVGIRLRQCARAGDVVARIGGDEFAVLLPDTEEGEAAALARRVIAAQDAQDGPTATVSLGLAELVGTDPDGRRMFRAADAAMYEAKSGGRGRFASGMSPVPRVDASAAVASADEKREGDLVLDARREKLEVEIILDTLIEEAPVGFVLVDHLLRTVRINPTLVALSGVPVEQLVGRAVEEAVPHLWNQLRAPITHVLQTGEAVRNVEIVRPSESDSSPFEATLASFFPVQLGEQSLGVGAVVVDISDRKHLEQSQELLTDAVIKALAAAAEARDPYTAGHQSRVGTIATAIAVELGYDPMTVRGIGVAASIHDIGNVAVPAEILSKPGRLTDAEMTIVKTHADAGYTILQDIEFPWPVAEMVRQHHERLDGSGYPLGLAGDEISIGGRIIAVADVVEAMSSHRPYRAAVGIEAALTTVKEGAGTLFDPDVVDACLRVIDSGELWLRDKPAA